jgi:hypothetical protein
LFCTKNANIFAKFFGENIKITTVPSWSTHMVDVMITFSQVYIYFLLPGSVAPLRVFLRKFSNFIYVSRSLCSCVCTLTNILHTKVLRPVFDLRWVVWLLKYF